VERTVAELRRGMIMAAGDALARLPLGTEEGTKGVGGGFQCKGSSNESGGSN
jgi:hypothetical protein